VGWVILYATCMNITGGNWAVWKLNAGSSQSLLMALLS